MMAVELCGDTNSTCMITRIVHAKSLFVLNSIASGDYFEHAVLVTFCYVRNNTEKSNISNPNIS